MEFHSHVVFTTLSGELLNDLNVMYISSPEQFACTLVFQYLSTYFRGFHLNIQLYMCIYISSPFFQQIPLFTEAAVFYIPGVGIWQFLTGSTHIINVFILLHLYFTIFSLGLGLWFLGWQLLIVSRGQTSYEAWKNINIYRHASVTSNFYDVFGSPLNALMCSAVPVRGSSPADGIKWNIRAKSEKGH